MKGGREGGIRRESGGEGQRENNMREGGGGGGREGDFLPEGLSSFTLCRSVVHISVLHGPAGDAIKNA